MTSLTPFLTDAAGQEHLLAADAITLGRGPECDIIITHPQASRQHARLYRAGRRFTLEDLGSTNGTRLNAAPLRSPTALQDRDCIEIGDVQLVYHDPDSTYRDAPFPTLEMDVAAGVVRVDRQSVELSPKEFELLSYLYAHSGEVCAKDAIGAAVWPEYQADVYDYQIKNLVRRLRAKIERDPAQPQVLLSVLGRGYKLLAPRTEE